MSDINKEIEYISSLKLTVHELRKYYDRIDDSEVKDNLKNVIVISNKIYKEVAGISITRTTQQMYNYITQSSGTDPI